MLVYKTENKINNKIYVGKACQKSTLRKGYLGSGKILRRALEKYGKENFKKTIIDVGESLEDLCNKEKFWISFYDAQNPDIGYNICPGGEGGCGGDTFTNNPNKEEIRKKISAARKGKPGPWKGKSFPLEMRQKISESRKGIIPWNKGKTCSAEHIQKNSDSHKGKTPWNKGMKMPFKSRTRRTA